MMAKSDGKNGLLQKVWIVLCVCALGEVSAAKPEQEANWEAGFENPSLETAPWVYWRWVWSYADRWSKEGITAELEAMKAQGIGGVNIEAGIGSAPKDKTVPEYMTPAWLELIEHAKNETERLGLGFCIHNCDGWATTGGPWITPENSMKRLVFSSLEVKGPQPGWSAILAKPDTLPPEIKKNPNPGEEVHTGKYDFYRDVAVLAFRNEGPWQPLNLSSRLKQSDSLSWDVPEGNWKVLRMGYTSTWRQNSVPSQAGAGLECDKRSPQGIEAHFQGIAPLLKVLRPANPSIKRYIGIDSWEAGAQNWTDIFPDEFNRAFGYDPIPYLPAALGVGRVNQAGRFMEDFQDLNVRMGERNYLGRFAELARDNGLHAHGETFGEATEVPMGEFWAMSASDRRHAVPDYFGDDPNRALSAGTFDAPARGRGFGRNVIAAESMTARSQNWERTPDYLKSGYDWGLCRGFNKMVMHLWAFQPDSQRKPHYMEHGTAINRHLTWWPQAHAWLAYLARCQYLLRQGAQVTDVAFIDRHSEVSRKNFVKKPFPHAYAYDILAWNQLQGLTPTADGVLACIPEGRSYRLIVLPESDSIEPAFLKRIAGLIEQGASVLGQKPARARGLANYLESDEKVRKIADRLWGEEPETKGCRTVGKGRLLWGMTVAEALAAMKIEPDFRCDGGAGEAGVDWAHRVADGRHIYFVVNRDKRAVTLKASFRIEGLTPELWDPVSGKIVKTALYEKRGGRTEVQLALEPYGSVFAVFREKGAVHFTSVSGPEAERVSAANLRVARDGWYELANVTSGAYELVTADNRRIKAQVPETLAPMALGGPWSVRFHDGMGAPAAPLSFPRLISWTEHENPAVKYYSGSATYGNSFSLTEEQAKPDRRRVLELGELGELADVTLNGEKLATVWHRPFRVDATGKLKAGRNTLEIRVANTWVNRFVGDLSLPQSKRVTVSGLACQDYKPDTPLPQSGLLGPVVLKEDAFVRMPPEAVDSNAVPVVRVKAREEYRTIPDEVYGQFIEHVGYCVNGPIGMWSEILLDRKFWRDFSNPAVHTVGGWAFNWIHQGEKGAGMVRTDRVAAHSGTWCVELLAGQDAACGFAELELAPVKAGKSLTLEGWCMRKDIGDDATPAVSLSGKNAEGKRVAFCRLTNLLDRAAAPGVWQPFRRTVDVPEGQWTLRVALELQNGLNRKGSVFLDDLKIVCDAAKAGLDNGGFETADRSRYSAWKLAGKVKLLVGEKAFSGRHSPTLADGGSIFQGGVVLRGTLNYNGRVVLRGAPGASCEVALEGSDGSERKVRLDGLAASWETRIFTFNVDKPVAEATFRITARGGEVAVGTVSLMPGDNIGGFRRDIVENMKQLKAPNYRWPGGCYVAAWRWKEQLGDPDRRAPYNYEEPNDVGLHEFMALCKELGTEPLICVNTCRNCEHGTPEYNRDLVLYCNSVGTPMAELRAKNGHPEPFHVRLWAVGNEMWGKWQGGHYDTVEEYAVKHNQTVAAMREADPSIKVVTVGYIGENTQGETLSKLTIGPTSPGWNKTMFKECAGTTDYISEHFYSKYTLKGKDLFGHMTDMRDNLQLRFDRYRQLYRETGVFKPIMLDEWNYWYGTNVYGNCGSAMFHKDGIGIAAGLHALYRNSDIVGGGNFALTVNALGAICANRIDSTLSGVGLPLALYRQHFGKQLVRVDNPDPKLEAVAAWTADRKALTVALINFGTVSRNVTLAIDGWKPATRTAAWYYIQHPDPEAQNVPGQAAALRIQEKRVPASSSALSLEPYSINLLVLPAK